MSGTNDDSGSQVNIAAAGFKWEEPGPITRDRNRSYLRAALAMLETRPGIWALIREYKGGGSASGMQSYCKEKFSGYEFTVRGKKLYARFVGPTSG